VDILPFHSNEEVAVAAAIARCTCALLVAGLLPAQDRPLDDLSPKEILSLAFKTVPEDFTSMATAPFRYPQESALIAGGLLVLVAADQPLTKAWQQHVVPNVNYRIAPLWKSSGGISGTDTWLVATLPVWYLGSLTLGSSQGQTAAVLGVKAATYSVLISQVTLKTLFGRERPLSDLAGGQPVPGYTDNPWSWGHFQRPHLAENSVDPSAFPSFHFTIYFAVARVFHEVYDTPWVPYGLALAGLGSSIQGHRHWVSDMTAGTLLGLGIGHTVVQNFRGAAPTKAGKVAWSLQPWADLQGQAGLALGMVW
jgi:membrane-associated phospholipid phosphatase